MGEDSGEKTEEPTPHKLREARKKGQIAKSKDLTSAVMLIVAFNVLKSTAPDMWEKMVDINLMALGQIGEEFTVSTVGYILQEALSTFLLALAPLFGANVAVAIIMETLQTGFLLSMGPLEPQLNKLNPLEGVKKYFSLKQYIELVKSIIKMTVVILILWGALKEQFKFVLISQQISLMQLMAIAGEIVMTTVTRVALFFFAIAIFDYFYQRYEYMKGLKMTKKEIKDEYKRLEGDPMVKQRQKEAQRNMSQGRQMGAVPESDVVVTNPIHIAIAIQYTPNKMKAPKVVAKGMRLVASEIKRIAELHFIPIVENPPLARSLYKTTEAGSDVPPPFYKAVAEILAFVYNLKKRKKHRY